MKGQPSCYKYNLITQAKGFWRLRLWRARFGFSNWHRRENYSLEKQEVTWCSTIGTNASSLQLCTWIFYFIIEARWANTFSCMYCECLKTILYMFAVYVLFTCTKEIELFRWIWYVSCWRCVVSDFMIVLVLWTTL